METKDDIVISFVFETYEDGIQIQKMLFEIRRMKGYVTYNDLSLLIFGKEMISHSLKLGWTELDDIKLEPGDESLEYWVLKMPELKDLTTVMKMIKIMKKENK